MLGLGEPGAYINRDGIVGFERVSKEVFNALVNREHGTNRLLL